MLINVSSHVFRDSFSTDPHQFISNGFIELNQHKVDSIVRLVENNGNNSVGLIAGITDKTLKSPFSAPFGGFHFNTCEFFFEAISDFIKHLKEYIVDNDLNSVEITLPPDIYHHSVNTRFVNSFFRNGFSMLTPEITNWVDLTLFNGKFTKREVMKNYRKALMHKLSLHDATDEKMKSEAYEIIVENRKLFGRPMHMTFEEVIRTSKIIPIDFFLVKDINNNNVGSAIFYRSHDKIVMGSFWGDTLAGRQLRAMDFLALNLYNHYKNLGYNYIDLGISSKAGIPNQGLIRFKEIHSCTSSLKYSFCWSR